MALTRRLFFGMGSGIYGLLAGRGLRAQATNLYQGRKQLADVSEVFAYGIASGDPLADRVILWTHVADRGADEISVYWQAALDSDFQNVVSDGQLVAKAENDYAVKVDAKLPYAATSYFYRFLAHGIWSSIGRTRTAPKTSSHLRMAVLSCSSIWSGSSGTITISSPGPPSPMR